MTHTIAAPAISSQLREAAGPLAAVLRALDEAPEAIPPAVALAAFALAAEQITAVCEACPDCAVIDDQCGPCAQLTEQSVTFILLAGDLRS